MSRILPPLNALRAFESAGRLESFSKAGEELHVSHSSISRHIRGLEARLGVQLFRNVARGVQLTKTGQEFLSEISCAFDRIEAATLEIAPESDTHISLSCEPTFALKWLMPAIGAFHEMHPSIEVDVHTSVDLVDIAKQECDLALRFCRFPPTNLDSDVISKSPVYPVGAPDLFGEVEGNPTTAQLGSKKFLQENHADLWDAWTDISGVPKQPMSRKSAVMRTMFAIEAAVAGQGLALVSMELVHNDIKAGRLKRFSDIGLEYGSYRLVYLKSTLRRKSVQTFRQWLLDATQELRPELG